MEAVRTPEGRFTDLPEFPYRPRWFEWQGLRLAYLDEGQGPPVVLFHGEPTWSFMYRRLIPPLLEAGYRVLAPDYPGFGRSDKPTDPVFYTYDRLTRAMADLIEHLDLTGSTGVVHDWGGPIGLRVAADHPDRFSRLVITNTALFTGTARPSEGLLRWRAFVERTEDLPIRFIMERSAETEWPEDVMTAYEAPFPDLASKTGARRLPLIVPLEPRDPGAAEMERVDGELRSWERPALVCFSDRDPIFGPPVAERLAARVPGARAPVIVEGAGHFLFEDRPHRVATEIVSFLDAARP